MDRIKNNVNIAVKNSKADLVLKNAWIVNVFTQSIVKSDIAISGEEIAGIGSYCGETEIDCEGFFVAPGFIDAHVHVESSKVVPEVYSRIVIKKGVTSCIADPHEIANVMGEEGILFMLENSKNSVIDMYYMLPSCVPAVDFDDNGAVLDWVMLEKLLGNPQILGLGEVMDVPSVIGGKEGMLKKLALFQSMIIDGHCPCINTDSLNAYAASGIKTDHECLTPEQAVEEIRRGLYVMLREGSAARNLKALLPAVDDRNFHRFLMCTDDKDIYDLEKEGSIDHNIKLAVKNGINPIHAITMATLNAAECYGLRRRGAVAPGYIADLVILSNLQDFYIKSVIRRGKLFEVSSGEPQSISIKPSMNIDHVSESLFKVPGKSDRVKVIKVIQDSINTQKVEREAIIIKNTVEGIKGQDVMKIAVFERHKRTGRYALGFIEGLGLHNCSVAQTISHDSHNIIVVGDNDKNMEIAVNRIIDMGGGIVIVSSGIVMEELSLPVGGLMSCENPEFVIEKIKRMNSIISKYEKTGGTDVFTALSFMALPVIPEFKITTRGLYDFTEGRFVDLFC